MKISVNWLRTYLETALSPERIGEILTSTGLEVESVEKVETIKGGLQGIVVGEVLTREKHPDADRLSVTTVNVGTGDPLQIVCGAANVAAGQKVLVATIGSTLYPVAGEPFKIKKSKIRGVESHGMICAEDEIGLGKSHDGIMVLPESTLPGTPAENLYTNEVDYLLEIGLTPNRTDALGHIGVARDLKAWLEVHEQKKISLNIPRPIIQATRQDNDLEISVKDEAACPRYSGAVIKNIKVSDSPQWLQNKLKTVGLKPINNIVDITNFVMMETGNPLHAFDLLKIGGKHVVIRTAHKGEQITTLDGVTRTLQPNNLLICDENTPMCIAGVFGGADSGISQDTTSLFLEAACFDAASIRKTSKGLGLNTDSSFRFERGVDSNNVIAARDRAISLVLEIAGGELTQLADHNPVPVAMKRIELNFDKCRKHCGSSFSNVEIVKILEALEIILVSSDATHAVLDIPTYRVDVTRPADIYEEVLRIYGFNAVPVPAKLNASISYRQKPDNEKLSNLVADLLVSSGFYEIMNNSLTSSAFLTNAQSETFSPSKNVKLLNPLSNELDVMRQSLIPGGLEVIEFNQNRQNPDLKLFEFGKVYTNEDGAYHESRQLALFMTGQRFAENWSTTPRRSDFYTIKGLVDKISQRINLHLTAGNTLTNDFLENGFQLLSGAAVIGEVGQVKQPLLKASGIKNVVFYAGFDWDAIVETAAAHTVTYAALPKTQFVRRDYSLLIDEAVRFEQIRSAAFKVEKALLQKVGLFDVYDGKNLQSGKKSYAVSFIFQDFEKTLQDEQVDRIMAAIRVKLEQELGAELR